MKELLPAAVYDATASDSKKARVLVLICGPPAYCKSVVDILQTWGYGNLQQEILRGNSNANSSEAAGNKDGLVRKFWLF